MSKNITKIGIVEAGPSGLAQALALKTVTNQVYDVVVLPERETKRLVIIEDPLTDKQIDVIKAMRNGYFIETTNKASYCAGIHITPKSLKYLKSIGLIKRFDFVGKYSTRHTLTEKGHRITL